MHRILWRRTMRQCYIELHDAYLWPPFTSGAQFFWLKTLALRSTSLLASVVLPALYETECRIWTEYYKEVDNSAILQMPNVLSHIMVFIPSLFLEPFRVLVKSTNPAQQVRHWLHPQQRPPHICATIRPTDSIQGHLIQRQSCAR